jgi:trk system potassium uptake protein TrkH
MGVLVFIMAFLPLSGAQNMHIMKAESPGPTVSKLVPRVKHTALILYLIYSVLTVVQLVLMLCGGMPFFDAVCTALGTAGTGGFGIKNDSMGSYSPYLQIVVTVFMFIFSINFNAYYLVLKGKFKDVLTSEIKTFCVIVAVAIAVITFNIYPMFTTVGEALRHSAFSVVSLISTSGYSTADFDLWPSLSKMLLLIVMFIGACAGSTGGGLKVSRVQIFIKGAGQEIGNLLHPRRVKKVSLEGKPLENEVVRTVNAYFGIYIIMFFASMILISFDNHDFTTNFSATAATLNNIGPGFSDVGPTCNYGFFSPLSKLVLSFNMLAGRLELFPMLLLFSPKTWRNK